MLQPRVSVIMNCLNCARYLREAIDSVYAQSYSTWEIIFYDNASCDESGEIAESYDDRLRYFRGDSTIPLGQARNKAISFAKGDLIAFLDCDDIWMPEKLAKQVPLFLADEEVGLVYSDTVFFNDNGVEKRLYATRKPYRGHRFPDLLNNYVISLETAVLRRKALDSLAHWFDERFNMIEEYDFFVRVGLNWKIDFVAEVLAKWRVHGDSWSWRFPDSFSQERRLMLEKLQQMPKIQADHADALALAWHRQKLSEAKIFWKNGDGRTARKIIGAESHRSVGGTLLSLASYLPYSTVEFVRRSVSREVVPTKSG